MSIARWTAPDGGIRCDCVACGNAGGADVTHPSGDPQLDRFVLCSTCNGKGWLEIYVDPLIEMARSRRLVHSQGAVFFGAAYRYHRAKAMKPASLPSDDCGDPLFRQAQLDCAAAISNFGPMAAVFDALMPRKAA